MKFRWFNSQKCWYGQCNHIQYRIYEDDAPLAFYVEIKVINKAINTKDRGQRFSSLEAAKEFCNVHNEKYVGKPRLAHNLGLDETDLKQEIDTLLAEKSLRLDDLHDIFLFFRKYENRLPWR